MNCLSRACLYFALMSVPMFAFGQQKTRPDPADPKVGVPPVVYVSPLKQYQPLGDEPVSPWKSANDVVEKAGGWKSYAREAQEPEPGTGKAVTPAPPQSKPAAHEGHAGQKKN